jgi:hypothetical protein
VLRRGRLGTVRTEQIPEVAMLVSAFVPPGRYRDDGDMHEVARTEPAGPHEWIDVLQPGFLPGFAQGHLEWVVLSGIPMTADLLEAPEALVPAQEHPLRPCVDDECRGRDMKGL